MPQSTLLLSIDDLKAEAGHFLGYGRGTVFGGSAWTTTQSNNITAVLKSGLAQVYTPPPLDRDPPHSWSFLQPYMEITIPQGQIEVLLPETFHGFVSPLFITDADSVGRKTQLRVRNEAYVRHLHGSQSSTTGWPKECAEVATVATSRLGSSRPGMIVWPTPDANYTLTAAYKHMPNALTGDFPYPPGGAEHSELFKASVIAAAELQLDDEPGPRAMFFRERLAASIAVDRKRKGQLLGYNGDRSAWRRHQIMGPHWGRYADVPPITYNGNSFD